jgi:hypothetical protein
MIYHFLNSPSLFPSPFSSPATLSVNQRQESIASSFWDRHRTERLHNRGILSDGARSHCGTLQPLRAFLGDRVERRVSCHSTSDYRRGGLAGGYPGITRRLLRTVARQSPRLSSGVILILEEISGSDSLDLKLLNQTLFFTMIFRNRSATFNKDLVASTY